MLNLIAILIWLVNGCILLSDGYKNNKEDDIIFDQSILSK